MTSNDWGGDGMAPTGHTPPSSRPSGLTDEEKQLIFMEAYRAAPICSCESLSLKTNVCSLVWMLRKFIESLA